jgi:hypothetical protein
MKKTFLIVVIVLLFIGGVSFLAWTIVKKDTSQASGTNKEKSENDELSVSLNKQDIEEDVEEGNSGQSVEVEEVEESDMVEEDVEESMPKEMDVDEESPVDMDTGAVANVAVEPQTPPQGRSEANITLSGAEGISAFSIKITTPEGVDIEEIKSTLDVVGAAEDDFSEVVNHVSDNRNSAVLSYATASLSDEELPKEISYTIVLDSKTGDGYIEVDAEDSEIIGPASVVYTVK